MTLTKQEFDRIVQRYNNLLILDVDACEAFDFVTEVLDAEIDALRERCPYATRTIAALEEARHAVWDIGGDAGNEDFDEN